MKKILLIIFIVICVFQMVVLATAIDIGSPAINRFTVWTAGHTVVAQENPANDTGKITSVEIWCNSNLINCEVATFFVVSGYNLSTRDTEAIGTVTAGAKRTFSVDLEVEAGDYIGFYASSGQIEYDFSGGPGVWYYYGDHIPCVNLSFTANPGRISLYGTGATEAEVNVIFFSTPF